MGITEQMALSWGFKYASRISNYVYMPGKWYKFKLSNTRTRLIKWKQKVGKTFDNIAYNWTIELIKSLECIISSFLTFIKLFMNMGWDM